MSNSPKYSEPRLTQEQERRLAAEREARAREEARQRAVAAVQSALARIEGRLGALDPADVSKFDPAGRQRTLDLLAAVRRVLSDRNVSAAASVMHEAETAAGEHERLVCRRADEWHRSHQAAVAEVGSLLDLLAALNADEVVMRWAAPVVRNLGRNVEELSSMVEREDFAAALSGCDAVRAAIDSCVAEAQERQLLDERRQYIASALASALAGLGFVVTAGNPRLADQNDPRSDLMLHARRLGGGAVAISVPQQGDVWYDVDGYPRRVVRGQDGANQVTCDEAENEILQLHAALQERYGIHMSELSWEGKPIDRAKRAERLPDGQKDQFRRLSGVPQQPPPIG